MEQAEKEMRMEKEREGGGKHRMTCRRVLRTSAGNMISCAAALAQAPATISSPNDRRLPLTASPPPPPAAAPRLPPPALLGTFPPWTFPPPRSPPVALSNLPAGPDTSPWHPLWSARSAHSSGKTTRPPAIAFHRDRIGLPWYKSCQKCFSAVYQPSNLAQLLVKSSPAFWAQAS